MLTAFSHRPFPAPCRPPPPWSLQLEQGPGSDGIFPTLPHLASGTKRDSPPPHPVPRKSTSSTVDLKPPALSDPHGSPWATDPGGANTAPDFKNKN